MTQEQLCAFLKNDLNMKSDAYGNIYKTDEKTVCFIAHLDIVDTTPPTYVSEVNGKIRGYNRYGMNQILGADDRAGVVLAYFCAKRYGTNCIFTLDEEVGGLGAVKFQAENFGQSTCFVQFDRKGNSDLITNTNGYNVCSDATREILLAISKREGLKHAKATGTATDVGYFASAKILSLSAVNVSTGYHSAHTSSEYLDISQFKNALKFAQAIAQDDELKQTQPHTPTYAYTTYKGGGMYFNSNNKGYKGRNYTSKETLWGDDDAFYNDSDDNRGQSLYMQKYNYMKDLKAQAVQVLTPTTFEKIDRSTLYLYDLDKKIKVWEDAINEHAPEVKKTAFVIPTKPTPAPVKLLTTPNARYTAAKVDELLLLLRTSLSYAEHKEIVIHCAGITAMSKKVSYLEQVCIDHRLPF